MRAEIFFFFYVFLRWSHYAVWLALSWKGLVGEGSLCLFFLYWGIEPRAFTQTVPPRSFFIPRVSQPFPGRSSCLSLLSSQDICHTWLRKGFLLFMQINEKGRRTRKEWGVGCGEKRLRFEKWEGHHGWMQGPLAALPREWGWSSCGPVLGPGDLDH